MNLTDFNSNIYANVVDPSYYCQSDSSVLDDTTSGMYRARPASANLDISHGQICISGSYNQFSISGRFNQFTGGQGYILCTIVYCLGEDGFLGENSKWRLNGCSYGVFFLWGGGLRLPLVVKRKNGRAKGRGVW